MILSALKGCCPQYYLHEADGAHNINCIRVMMPTILPALGNAAHNITCIRGIPPMIIPSLGGCCPQ